MTALNHNIWHFSNQDQTLQFTMSRPIHFRSFMVQMYAVWHSFQSMDQWYLHHILYIPSRAHFFNNEVRSRTWPLSVVSSLTYTMQYTQCKVQNTYPIGRKPYHVTNSSHVIRHFLCTLRSLCKTLHCLCYARYIRCIACVRLETALYQLPSSHCGEMAIPIWPHWYVTESFTSITAGTNHTQRQRQWLTGRSRLNWILTIEHIFNNTIFT